MKKWLACLLASAWLVIAAVAWAQPQIPPAPANNVYVQDNAGVLSSATKNRINEVGSYLQEKTTAKLMAVTVKSFGDAAPEEYGLAILRQWGVGDKERNNGVVLVVATEDRKARIEVGYGLEGALPDAKTGRIQDEYMLPFFRQQDYDKGILNGYLALASVTAAEYGLELPTGSKGVTKSGAVHQDSAWAALPWWMKAVAAGLLLLLFIFDWVFLGGSITWLLLSLLRFRGGGGGGGGPGGRGGFGGGSGGGGGSSRNW